MCIVEYEFTIEMFICWRIVNYKFDFLMLIYVADEIYDCEKTFERLFLGAIFGTNAPYFIAGWRSDFKDQVFEESYQLNIIFQLFCSLLCL